MVREILKIRTDNGLGNNNPTFKDIELTEYSAKFPRMGMPSLSATLKWATPLDDEWTGKEYVVLRGERFYIRHTPSGKKDNQDQRYSHEIEFTSEFAEILGNTYFMDAVPDIKSGIVCQTRNKPCTNNTKFTFYGTIGEFVDRLNCAFLYAKINDSALNVKTSLTTNDTVTGDGYCAMLDPYGAGSQYDPNKSYEFSFEDKSLWEAITYGHETTETPFERRGKKIIFGAQPVTISHSFEYGHDNELLSVYHKNANAKVINRITMLGSSENIPHYYPNETEYGHISIVAKDGNSALEASMLEVVNMTQLLGKLSPDKYAVLSKTEIKNDNGLPFLSLSAGFGSENDYTLNPYSFGKELKNYDPDSPLVHKYLHVEFEFSVENEGDYVCDRIEGRSWRQDTSSPSENKDMPLTGFIPVHLSKIGDGGASVNLDSQIGKAGFDGNMTFGHLGAGRYKAHIMLTVINKSGTSSLTPVASFYLISSINVVNEIYANTKTYKYGWDLGNGKILNIGELGVRLNASVTDAMVGDGFGWEASGRMPFQDHLMPTKYRNTLGEERFYNALNNTYADPDTGDKYVFPNPYIEGAPSEHIHRNEEIKPTIEGVKNAAGQLMGVIADIAYDANDNDLLKSDATEDNDKNDSLKYEHSFFYIKLNIFNGTYGFDLFNHASQSDPMTLQMTSGNCNGCKFKIQALEYEDETGLKSYKNPVQTTGANGNIVSGDYEDKVKKEWQSWQQNTQTNSIWICVQKDAETFGVVMPNQSNNFKPAIGDTFNIINIDLPQGYILAAEKRLEEDGIRFMADNNEEKFTFDIQASRIFFAENPQVLAQLDEYSVIKVKYNGREYEQYVNQLTIDCKDSEALPNIGIDLTDTLAVGQSFVDQVAERASSLIANPYTMGGALGGSGGLSTALADKRYLKKTESDRSKGKIASDIGFEIGEFVSGASGGIFFRDPETGQTYIEVDKIKARMKAIFEELEIAKVSTIGGKFVITPGGGMNISFVEELTNSYRCYFKAKDEDKGAECRFIVGDQVQCHEFNIQNGTTKDASNRYYWRLVTAVNNTESYIELSKTDRDDASDMPSDAPQSGDTIVQLGNRNDATRQSAIILSTIDAFAPCVTLFNGIDHYSLDGKAVVEYGVDKTKTPPEPFFNCYGRFFFGPKGGNSYLKFEPSVDRLIFSGELINISTLNGKDIDQYIKDVVPPVTQEDIEGYVNAIVDPQIEGIQNQIDGVIETWFYNGVPTLSNYPASDWNTDNLKIQHLGDLYYDNDTGTAYRFSQDTDDNFYWNVITDDAITKALAAAKDAQDTADGKRRVFTSQPTANDEYDEGDLWVNATYGTQYNNDILRCIVEHKAKGEPFNISHWTLASKYTDDSALNQFISDYEDTIDDIKGQIDGKAETWYQPTDPSTAWNTPELKALHVGDLWYNTTDGTTWYWDGSQWKQQDVPDSVFDKIDGKADIFVLKPTDGYHKNDLWFLESDYTLSDGAHKAGTLAVALNDMGTAWSANDWAKKDRYTDDTLAQSAKDEIAGYAYIKEALKGNTVINGGLVLSSLIKLGIWTGEGEKATLSKVYAGVNGVRKTDKSPFLWGGGDMVDKYYDANGNARTTALESGFAASLLRMDGSAYFAKGNIGFNADGSGWLGGEDKIKFGADGSMVFGSGIKINLNTGEKGLKETIESFANILTYFIPEDSLGNTVAWGGNVVRIRVTKGFYSDGFISARGANPDGSTGGATQLRMLDDVLIGSNLTSGQALVFNGTKWVNQAISTGLNTTELANYLTTNNYAKKSDIPSLTGYATETWVEGKGYLTDYTIHALTLQAGAFSAKTYNPKSGAATVNIPTTTSHISEGTNKYFTDARAQAALADTVSSMNTALDGKVSKSGDTMTGLLNIGLNSLTLTIGAQNSTCVHFYTSDTTKPFAINPSGVLMVGNGTLGTSGYRAGNVYSILGNFSGQVTAQSLKIGDCEITWDATNGGLKFSKGIYSESYVSARGSNTSGGSSSGGGTSYNRLDNWSDYATGKEGYVLSAGLGFDLYSNKADKSSLANLVDKTSAQEISGLKSFASGLKVKGRVYGSGDDEGIIIERASNNYAGLILGGATGLRVAFCLTPDNKGVWAFNDGTNAYKLEHPKAGGVLATQEWVSGKNYLTSHQSLANYVTLNGVQTISGGKRFSNFLTIVGYKSSAGATRNTSGVLSFCEGGWDDNFAIWANFSGSGASQDLFIGGGGSGLSQSIDIDSPVLTPYLTINHTTGNLTVKGSIIKQGGTASQILMADGSTQNLYKASEVTTATSDSGTLTPYAMNQWTAKTYLPLTGGMLTGLLHVNVNGTTFDIGGQNSSFVHLYSSVSCIFNKPLYVMGEIYAGSGYNQKVWHSGNDGNGSGLDADLLDGLHYSAFARADQSYAVDLNAVNGIGMMCNPMDAHATSERHYPIAEAGCLIYCTAAYGSANQIYGTYSSNRWFARGGSSNSSTNLLKTAWREFAMKDDNVASATKLANTRTIWGQNFNGEGNVSGNMTGVGSITASGNIITSAGISSTSIKIELDNNNSTAGMGGEINRYGGSLYLQHRGNQATSPTGNVLMVCNGGNVGVGTTNPAYKLDVNGNVKASGYLYSSGIYLQNATAQKGFYFDISDSGIMWIGKHENYGSLDLVMQFNPNNKIVDIVGTLHVSVGMYSDGYVSARGQNTSDVRLKTDIRDFNATDIIKALHPVSFRWNDFAKGRFEVFRTDEAQYGLIAQETERVAPWLVDRNMFNDGLWGVHYERLIPILLQGEREQIFRIDNLLVSVKSHEDEIRELKEEVKRLNKRIKMLEKH